MARGRGPAGAKDKKTQSPAESFASSERRQTIVDRQQQSIPHSCKTPRLPNRMSPAFLDLLLT